MNTTGILIQLVFLAIALFITIIAIENNKKIMLKDPTEDNINWTILWSALFGVTTMLMLNTIIKSLEG